MENNKTPEKETKKANKFLLIYSLIIIIGSLATVLIFITHFKAFLIALGFYLMGVFGHYGFKIFIDELKKVKTRKW